MELKDECLHEFKAAIVCIKCKQQFDILTLIKELKTKTEEKPPDLNVHAIEHLGADAQLP